MTDGANSVKMTFEEKVIQHIKTQGIAALVDDETALLDLAKRAVNEALFKSRIVERGYNNREEILSPVMQAASDIAKQATAQIIPTIVAELVQDPKFVDAIRTASILAITNDVVNSTKHTSDIAMKDLSHKLSMVTQQSGNKEFVDLSNKLLEVLYKWNATSDGIAITKAPV